MKSMNFDTQEHIKDAAKVISQYCDIIGIRTFASLKNQKKDYEEIIINNYKSGPVASRYFNALTDIQYGRSADPFGWILTI